MFQLLKTDEASIIRKTLDVCINEYASRSELRENAAKSTFLVSPETHRKLITICKLTGQTQQEIYKRALDSYLVKDYLKDIPICKFK